MSGLSDDNLRAAADEAGISPNELRHELALRAPSDLAVAGGTSVVGAPTRGTSVTHVEGRVAAPRPEALGSVRESIERQTGKRGHKQGEEEADIVDDDRGVTYRVRTSDDGSGGALVRVDVDPGQARGTRALALTGLGGVTAVVLLLGWWLSTGLLIGGLVGAGLTALYWRSSVARERQAIRSAHAVAAQSLSDAEHRPALPPADT